MCPAGKIAVRGEDEHHTEWETCIECPVGKFAPTPGSTACLECAVGSYQDKVGASSCKQCPGEGEETLINGSSTLHDCACARGYYGPHCPELDASDREKTWLETDNETKFEADSGSTYTCHDGNFERWLQDGICDDPFIKEDPCMLTVEYEIPQVEYHKQEFFRHRPRYMHFGVALAPEMDARPHQYKVSVFNRSSAQFQELDGEYWKKAEIWKPGVDRALEHVGNASVNISGDMHALLDLAPAQRVQHEDFTRLKLQVRGFKFDHDTFERKCTSFELFRTGMYYYMGEWEDCHRHICTACIPGKYQETVNKTTCEFCQAGTFTHDEGRSTCSQCTSGSYSLDNATECRCNSGFKNTSASGPDLRCEACAFGKYKNVTGPGECVDCVAGKASAVLNATSIQTCQTCPADMYAKPGSGDCQLCPRTQSLKKVRRLAIARQDIIITVKSRGVWPAPGVASRSVEGGRLRGLRGWKV